LDHTEADRRTVRQIDDPSFDKRASIVDPNAYHTPGFQMGHNRLDTQWGVLVGRANVVHVVPFTIGGAPAVKGDAIPGSYAVLHPGGSDLR
jgi:hypothetical protein